MTIGVGSMIAYPYRKPNAKKTQLVVALVARWNGNLDRPALCITTSLERHWPILDPATFFGAWVGVYPVGATNAEGHVVLTEEHARNCRRSIEAHLATKAGAELLKTRWKKADTLIVPPDTGRLEEYEVPLRPFPGKGSMASVEMDTYLGPGVARRQWLTSWQDKHPASYDVFLRNAHHKKPDTPRVHGIGLLDPSSIEAA